MHISPIRKKATEYLKQVPSEGSSAQRSKVVEDFVDALVEEFPEQAQIGKLAGKLSRRALHDGTKEQLFEQALQLTSEGVTGLGAVTWALVNKGIDREEKLRLAVPGFKELRKHGLDKDLGGLIERFGDRPAKLAAVRAKSRYGSLADGKALKEIQSESRNPALGKAIVTLKSQQNTFYELAASMMGGSFGFLGKARKKVVATTFLGAEREPQTLAESAKLAAESLSRMKPSDARRAGFRALKFLEGQSPGDRGLARLVHSAISTWSDTPRNIASSLRDGIQTMGKPEVDGTHIARTVYSLLSPRHERDLMTQGLKVIMTAGQLDQAPNFKAAFRTTFAVATTMEETLVIFEPSKTVKSMLSKLSEPEAAKDPVRAVAGEVLNGEPLRAVDRVMKGEEVSASDHPVSRALWKALATEAATIEEREAARRLFEGSACSTSPA